MAKKKIKAATWAEMPEVMTPDQTQTILQISRATFFRWVADGKMPGAVKIGDSWRVNRDQLRDYIQGEIRADDPD